MTKKQKTKKTTTNSKNAWIGGAVAVLAAGAAVGLARSGWQPFKGKKGSSEGAGNASAKAVASTGGAGKVDIDLNEEVASAIESTPKSEKSFTDEGATGNND
jgi:hypothetical protein